MENASKALIIAGAILLAILIISLGIVVINNSRDTINNANVDKQAAETFNNQFEVYVSNKATVNQARAIMSSAFATAGGTHTVKVKFAASGNATETTSMPPLDNTKTYTTSVTYSNGYVSEVTVKQNS